MVNAKNIHEALANKCKRKHRSQKYKTSANMVPHDTLITDYEGHHDLMSQEQEVVKYAKVNSDNSRCFGIDDVPSKGPNKEISRHPLIVSEFSPDIAKRARN